MSFIYSDKCEAKAKEKAQISLKSFSTASLLLQLLGNPALTTTSHRVNTLLKAEACFVGREYSVTSFTLMRRAFLNSLSIAKSSSSLYVRDFLCRIKATSFQTSGLLQKDIGKHVRDFETAKYHGTAHKQFHVCPRSAVHGGSVIRNGHQSRLRLNQ